MKKNGRPNRGGGKYNKGKGGGGPGPSAGAKILLDQSMFLPPIYLDSSRYENFLPFPVPEFFYYFLKEVSFQIHLVL